VKTPLARKLLGLCAAVLLVFTGFIVWAPRTATIRIVTTAPGTNVTVKWISADSTGVIQDTPAPLTLRFPSERLRVEIVSSDSADITLSVEIRSGTRIRSSAVASGGGPLVVHAEGADVAACSGRSPQSACQFK
jgi:hypothetical protein